VREAEYRGLLDVVIDAAEVAGKQLLKCRTGNSSMVREQIKKDGTIVTEADRFSNQLILDLLGRTYPDIGIFSEESPRDPRYRTADSLFVVDPLDGTNQFVHGLSDFTVSIAFTEREGRFHRPTLGVVYRPVGKDMYFAVRGCGAWHRSGSGDLQRLNVSQVNDWSRARLVCSALRSDPATERLRASVGTCTGRGSAALMICLVAQGKFEWYAHAAGRHLAEYDVCAAGIILEEAGGRLGHATGASIRYNRVDPKMKNGVVAASEILFDQAVATMRELSLP
jgi:3'(2'), 5'-bisphosphate nucleotidase